MMSDDPCEKQRQFKYRNHDFAIADFSDRDAAEVKDQAVSALVNFREGNTVKLTVDAFLGFLTKRGFRITREKK